MAADAHSKNSKNNLNFILFCTQTNELGEKQKEKKRFFKAKIIILEFHNSHFMNF